MANGAQVPARQWNLALWALALGVLATLGGLVLAGSILGGYFVATLAVVASPLFLREHPKAFARACLVLGAGLLVWSLVGALIGMFLFLPAVVLLFIAAFVRPGNRPGVWWAVAVPLALALMTQVPFFGSPSTGSEPPPYFQATLDSSDRFHDRDFNLRKGSLRQYGATRIEVYESAGKLRLDVGFAESLGNGSDRDQLQEAIAVLPGVVGVRLCTVHTC